MFERERERERDKEKGHVGKTYIAACNLEGRDISPADFDLLDGPADLVHDATELMAQDISRV